MVGECYTHQKYLYTNHPRGEEMTNAPIRYKVEKRTTPRKSEEELRREIIQVCHMLWQKGLAVAADGNVSARLGQDRFLCTPSGFSKGLLEADQLLVVDWNVEPVEPRTEANKDLRPSSEMLLHLEAYRQRPEIGAVVHAHPTTAVALSILGIDIAPCYLPDVVLGLGVIPISDYATPSSAEGAAVISDLITRCDALVLRRHGSVTVGGSPLEAYLRLEKLEQVAQITRIVHQLGGAQKLPAEEMEKLIAWRVGQGIMYPGQEEDVRTMAGMTI
jgi:L-fuculose-phosphate aldolase